MTETREFQENFYILDDGRVRQFLITGPEEALLIDTGFPDSGVYSAVKALTDKPVKVALTHGDRDHTGGLERFGACWLHPRDWRLVQGDVTGAVVVLEGERASLPGQDGEEQQAVLTAGFLARQLES